jgi:hypothetical protein
MDVSSSGIMEDAEALVGIGRRKSLAIEGIVQRELIRVKVVSLNMS